MQWSAVAAGAVVLAVLAAPAPAAADDDGVKTACLASFDAGQKLKLDGKLGRAREELMRCSQAECPALVRQDCAALVNEVNAAEPSVVFAAKDDAGRDVVAVRVTVDGAVVTERLDGRPVEVDPGVHQVRYEAAGLPPVDDQFVARAGEKLRVFYETVRAPHAEVATEPSRRGPPVVTYVLGGVGVLALGAAAVLDVVATSDAHDLRSTCAPACAQSDVDAVRLKYILASVGLGVGVVSLAGAAYFLLAPRAPSPPSPSASVFFFDVAPGPKGVTGAVGARF